MDTASKPPRNCDHQCGGAAARIFASSADEEICISGVSGQFPSSRNVAEFEENLYNKVDMINEHSARWPHYHTEIPRRSGNIHDIDRFDAQFFGVNRKQAEIMDPQGRLLLERAYEAITDAGVNPKSLRGSRTGVYIGACFAESEKTWFYDRLSERGFGITGCSRAMLANRISYSLGLEGPSFLLDTACSSSMYALDAAFSAMRSGQCDAAIVGGANLLLNPNTTVQFARLGVLAPDGFCRPFDRDASGYVRAEAICAVFLQKARMARRVYATVVYSKTNCDGFKQQGITYPSGRIQEKLLTEFYADVRIDPHTVEYVEAHSTGTVAGDPEECVALDNVFCRPGRTAPLLVGSVKSNIGHSESTSGVCSIAKVVCAFERGAIAPNINFAHRRDEIAGLRSERMRVCTEVTPFGVATVPLVGINSFGFGGANAHALLRGNARQKVNAGRPADDLPRLVQWAGRTEESNAVMMGYLRSHPLDAEFIGLLHGIQSVEEPGFLHRCYGLFAKAPADGPSDAAAVCLAEHAQRFDGLRRPMVWIFSGMGSQWPQMGRSLLRLPLFRESIERSAALVQPLGLDLMNIITADSSALFDDIVHSFVGIAAMQIGLVDILRALDLQPDFLIGHSVGELGCGYADGALSARQMLLAAYWRGYASREAQLAPGAMAAIGLNAAAIRGQLPGDIDVACHNSAESCTVSGPAASVAALVEALKARGVFARVVNSSNIAYHSRYVSGIGARLLERTRELLGEPVLRSERWLSTSVPRAGWSATDCRFSGPEYYVNNLLNPVLFEDTVASLPANAIAVEVAPHGLLQAIVRRSMTAAVHVPLTQRGCADGAAFLLEALGRLYVNGCTMPLERMYAAVEWPVGRGTAKIASLLRWDHADGYFVTKFEAGRAPESGEMRVQVNLGDSEYAYVAGHNIDGRCLFPATGYLELVWITFARMRGSVHHLLNVEFEDVQFLRATALHANTAVELTVMVHYGNGAFEVSEGAASICTGTVRVIAATETPLDLPAPQCAPYPDLQRAEFYRELRLRGYQYRGDFRAVERARSDGQTGRIRWTMNWVAFMDCMLQIGILSQDTRSLMLPTRIQRVRIFPGEHAQRVQAVTAVAATAAAAGRDETDAGELLCDVHMSRELNVIQAGGVEIHGMVTNVVARRKAAGELVLEEYRFVAYDSAAHVLSLDDAVRVCVQLVLENLPEITVLRAVEVRQQCSDEMLATEKPLLLGIVDEVLAQMPVIVGQLTVLVTDPVASGEQQNYRQLDVRQGRVAEQSQLHLVICGADADLGDVAFWQEAELSLADGAFVLARFSHDDVLRPAGFNLISRLAMDDADGDCLVLLRKILNTVSTDLEYHVVDISRARDSIEWLDELKAAAAVRNNRVLLLAQSDPMSGIVGLVNCLRRESLDARSVGCVFVDDDRAPEFEASGTFYGKQLQLDLAMNVLKDGSWGSYRHLKLNPNHTPGPSATTNNQLTHVYANVQRTGDLSSFAWLQGPLQPPPVVAAVASVAHTNDDLVRVHYSAINFRDVMLATGRLSSDIFDMRRVDRDCVLGLEYAGVRLTDGRRLMGMVTSGAMATLVRPFRPLTWTVPDGWSMRDAATVPVVYVTVYCAFFMGRVVTAGKSILIHAGSGGVGLAAIRVAFAYGLEVYTTVSTAQKRRYLLQMFGQLKESNIGNSRDCSFERMIKLRTRGRGVDFVLNSLSDDKLQASVRCLGRGGVFLEIGKFDLANDTKLGLGAFLKEMSFRSVLADNLFAQPDGDDQTRYIHALIDRDLRSGVIQPLAATVFGVNEVEKAYRYLSTGQHVGKVLVQVQDEDEGTQVENPGVECTAVPPTVLPRAYFDAEMVYVVAGGLGGFGLELTDWLVLRGARRVLLSSSRGISSKYQVYRMRIWQNYGCNIHVSTADIRTAAGCRELLTQAGHLGRIAGIFNLAVSLHDAALANQTAATVRACLAPKADATGHLDRLSRELCPQLAHFVVFSSVSCGRGNAGQSNYGLANAMMERIVERRVADGLAGKAIQWGAVGDVGLVADMMMATAAETERTDSSGIDWASEVIAGTLQQPMASCLAVLDTLLAAAQPVVASMVVARKHTDGKSGAGEQRTAASVLESVLNIMGIRNMNTISMSSSLSELGMDSLMTIEIKQALEREFEIVLSAHELRAMTFERLQRLSDMGAVRTADVELGGQPVATSVGTYATMFDMRGLLAEPVRREERRLYRLGGGRADKADGRTWIVMPGAEGDDRPVWQTIADGTNGTVFIVKYEEAAEEQSVLELAEIYAKDILAQFPHTTHFHLIGYSFGTLIALETARLLEHHRRHVQQLFCIDGAPHFLHRLICDFCQCSVADFAVATLESLIAGALAQTYTSAANSTELQRRLDQLDGWPAKLDTVVEYVTEQRGQHFDDTFMRSFATGLYQRAMATVRYAAAMEEPTGEQRQQRIEAAVTLVRASDAAVPDIDEQYGLQHCTTGRIDVQFVAGNHQTVLQSARLVDIINGV